MKPERFITVPLGRHADPPLGPQPNRYAPYFMACASEQNTLLLQRKHWATALEEGIRGRAFRKERGRYLLFTLQPAERLGFPQQTRSGFEMWSGTLVRRKGSEHREQCQICSSVISPIHHCLLRSATEPQNSTSSEPGQTKSTSLQLQEARLSDSSSKSFSAEISTQTASLQVRQSVLSDPSPLVLFSDGGFSLNEDKTSPITH